MERYFSIVMQAKGQHLVGEKHVSPSSEDLSWHACSIEWLSDGVTFVVANKRGNISLFSRTGDFLKLVNAETNQLDFFYPIQFNHEKYNEEPVCTI